MLFMDALELDSFETGAGLSVPDLLPGNVDRELTKAYTAFSSGQPVNPAAGRYTEVVTGLWGCRAFGGNKEIKTVIQWCAASLADVPLAFVCEAVSTLVFESPCG
jgi:poly(ADP-ribose) glycohydrolase